MFNPAETYFKRDLLNIFDRYKQITTTWYGYIDKNELSGSGKEPVRVEAKTGRNDPCLCGSGKKYKKCCLNQKRNDHVHYFSKNGHTAKSCSFYSWNRVSYQRLK